jgi:hypothetical protein
MRTNMRPDHVVTDIVPRQSLLASPLEDIDDVSESPRQMSACRASLSA